MSCFEYMENFSIVMMKSVYRYAFSKLKRIKNFFMIVKEKNGIMIDKKLLKQNEEFHNKYIGKRCFIIGNGPSLNDIDFSLLKDEITFTVNHLPRNQQFANLNTNYHIWTDQRELKLSEITKNPEMLNVMKSVNTGRNKPVVFYEYKMFDLIEECCLNDELNIRYIALLNQDLELYLKKGKIDITDFIPDNPTVVQTAIIIAIYMGFSEIYLLGCDCTGFITTAYAKMNEAENSKYCYSISKLEKIRIEDSAKKKDIKEELLSYAKLFDHYELLYKFCKKNNVKLCNATERSLLDTLPQVKLSDILK